MKASYVNHKASKEGTRRKRGEEMGGGRSEKEHGKLYEESDDAKMTCD